MDKMIKTSFGTPILILDEGVEVPKEGNFYIVAANGLFLQKDNGLLQAIVRVDGVSVLEDFGGKNFQPTVSHNLPKIATELVVKIKTFFAKVVEKYHAEACVILFYNKETQSYAINVPQQIVSHAGVRYESGSHTHEANGYIPVGTIHSHCDFQAFHSGTDIHDEEDWDGLHITFGHNHLDDFTISSTVVMGGVRTKIDSLTVLEGIESVGINGKDDYFRLTKNDVDVGEVDTWLEQVKPWEQRTVSAQVMDAIFHHAARQTWPNFGQLPDEGVGE